MASFGENLRREREMRGVTLDEISGATKISVRFLQALETEEFFKLPGGIFTRSFIRAYSQYLGLNEDSVLAEYQLVAQTKSDVDLSRMTLTRPTPLLAGSRTRLFALLVAAAMLSAGYALFRFSRRAAEIPMTRSNLTEVPAAPSPAATQSPQRSLRTPVARLAASAPARRPSAEPALGSQTVPGVANPLSSQSAGASFDTRGEEAGLVLQVAATERAWVAVDADGKTTLQRVLIPNEIQTLKAKESFDVTTGNAQGVILTLNGETLKPLGRRGEVKSVHLTHDDLKNPAP